MYRGLTMSPRTKVQREQDLRPLTLEEHLASVEDAAAFLAEAQNEALRRRAELERRIRLAQGAKASLRKIAKASGLSHTTVQTIGEK